MSQAKPTQRSDIPYRVFGGRAALIIPGDPFLCRLNPVATRIWELADGSRTILDIAGSLCAEFDVDHDTAIRDVACMVDHFADQHMLEGTRSPSPIADRAALPHHPQSRPSPEDDLSRFAREHCVPLNATMEVTLRCNLACTHCYNFDREVPYTRHDAAGELTAEEMIGVIDQLADASCLYLWFTGGEAMMQPRLCELIRHARKRRFWVGLKTNGTMLTPSSVASLHEAGVLGLHVSLYGITPDTHDAFTKRPGSFRRTLQGIRLARQSRIDVRINMSVTHENAAEVQGVIDLAKELGCSYGINPFISARYDGTVSSCEHQPDGPTLKSLYRGALRPYLDQPNFKPDASVQCGCARGTCGITATGIVYPCIGAPLPSGNLREQSFQEIWVHSPQFQRIRSLQLDDFTDCKTCSDRPFCARNSGFVFTNTGNYTGPEPFTCMDAAARREVFTGDDSPPFPFRARKSEGTRRLRVI